MYEPQNLGTPQSLELEPTVNCESIKVGHWPFRRIQVRRRRSYVVHPRLTRNRCVADIHIPFYARVRNNDSQAIVTGRHVPHDPTPDDLEQGAFLIEHDRSEYPRVDQPHVCVRHVARGPRTAPFRRNLSALQRHTGTARVRRWNCKSYMPVESCPTAVISESRISSERLLTIATFSRRPETWIATS